MGSVHSAIENVMVVYLICLTQMDNLTEMGVACQWDRITLCGGWNRLYTAPYKITLWFDYNQNQPNVIYYNYMAAWTIYREIWSNQIAHNFLHRFPPVSNRWPYSPCNTCTLVHVPASLSTMPCRHATPLGPHARPALCVLSETGVWGLYNLRPPLDCRIGIGFLLDSTS